MVLRLNNGVGFLCLCICSVLLDALVSTVSELLFLNLYSVFLIATFLDDHVPWYHTDKLAFNNVKRSGGVAFSFQANGRCSSGCYCYHLQTPEGLYDTFAFILLKLQHTTCCLVPHTNLTGKWDLQNMHTTHSFQIIGWIQVRIKQTKGSD